MTTISQERAARIESVAVSAYSVPTATDQESDGTLVWDSTTIVVVELTSGEHTGLGDTYCHPAAGQVIQSEVRRHPRRSAPADAPADMGADAGLYAPDQLRHQVEGWRDARRYQVD